MSVEELLTAARADNWAATGLSALSETFGLPAGATPFHLDQKSLEGAVTSKAAELAPAFGPELARSVAASTVILGGIAEMLDEIRRLLTASDAAPPRQAVIARCVRVYGELEAAKDLLLEAVREVATGAADGSPESRAATGACCEKASSFALEAFASLLPFIAAEEPQLDLADRFSRFAQNVTALLTTARSVLGARSGAESTASLMRRHGVRAAVS